MTNGTVARIVKVRVGSVVATVSWLYAWIERASGEVAYVGASGFDPELRASSRDV